MEMEESVEGIGYVVESRPSSYFYRYPCIKTPADYAIVLLRAWAKKEYVDPKRIGIWGWVSLVFLKLLFVSNRAMLHGYLFRR